MRWDKRLEELKKDRQAGRPPLEKLDGVRLARFRDFQAKHGEVDVGEKSESGPSSAKATDGVPSPPDAAAVPEPTAVLNCIQLKFGPLSFTKRPWWWDRYHKHGWVKPQKVLPITRNSTLLSHRSVR